MREDPANHVIESLTANPWPRPSKPLRVLRWMPDHTRCGAIVERAGRGCRNTRWGTLPVCEFHANVSRSCGVEYV